MTEGTPQPTVAPPSPAGAPGEGRQQSVSPDHRARRRAQTRRRIYRAALQLFEERGYEKVTTGEIAAAAGVSVPTFYDHFPGKEHLVMALPEPGDVDALLARQPADLPLGERVRRALLTVVGGLEGERRSDVLARWRIVVTTPGLRYRAAEFERTTAQMFLDSLGLGGSGGSPAAQVVVTAHLAAYTQALLRWAESDGERPLEEVAREVMDALRGL
ncbi:TetR/AcrR family transcriptional regulator [Geodermatophilus sp. TF02-6]|uniref:TetR/AcrR family transcriptional regulator n=1 Tax=Geodermatophilus sp. TF02-6 TaxID=2250575 RepID=UPI001314F01B|nr:TetR/AcrR family transcriptional regulator [Geodermatophilus sp. TF02-6]